MVPRRESANRTTKEYIWFLSIAYLNKKIVLHDVWRMLKLTLWQFVHFNNAAVIILFIQQRLADMALRLEAARLLTWRAAVIRDTGERSTKVCKNVTAVSFLIS